MAKREKLLINHRLFTAAQRHLVGGVDSPVRSFNYVGGEPLLVARGKGSKIYDYDGNSYIDYVLSWGSMILGHAYPVVIQNLQKSVKSGLSFGTTNKLEIELAQKIKEAIPLIEKIRFVNSGTEAVMGAVRLARGCTEKNKIVKFAKAYHGHADYLLAKGGSGLATLRIPASAGVPRDMIKHTLIAPQGDREFIEKLFRIHKGQIAAVLVEPVGGNYGVIPPDIGFLRYLRQLTRKHGSLLIFDEVITGFRFGFHSAAQEFGVVPDLLCLGKIIGGGLPIGAYGGKDRIMKHLAPVGQVYQASTFSGNPIVMQAGLSTLKALEKLKDNYTKLKGMAKQLSSGLEHESRLRNIELKTSYYGTMFSLKFNDTDQFKRFYHLLLARGVYFAPSEFEANFLSFSHSQQDIRQTMVSIRWVLDKIRK